MKNVKHTFCLLLLLVFIQGIVSGQEKQTLGNNASSDELGIIDSTAVANWVHLDSDDNVDISNDGIFIAYRIANIPKRGKTIVVKSLLSNREDSFVNANKIGFTADSRSFLFSKGDTIIQRWLSTGSEKRISGAEVISRPAEGGIRWLAYRQSKGNNIILKNFGSGEAKQNRNASAVYFHDKGKFAAVVSADSTSGLERLELQSLDVNQCVSVYNEINTKITSVAFNSLGDLAFLTMQQKDGLNAMTLWTYNIQQNILIKRFVSDQHNAISAFNFSNDGRYVFFDLERFDTVRSRANLLGLNLWNYKDMENQRRQLKLPFVAAVKYVVPVEASNQHKAIRLTQEQESLWSDATHANIVFVKKDVSDNRSWRTHLDTIYQVSILDGSRRVFPARNASSFFVTENGRYIIYYDTAVKSYFTYNIKLEKFSNITADLPANQFIYDEGFTINNGGLNKYITPREVIGWDHDELLVYDNFDIWRLDPTGKNKARNLTNGYGAKNSIRFSVLDQNFQHDKKHKHGLLLSAFDVKTKRSGFYFADAFYSSDPIRLTLAPYNYCILDRQLPSNNHRFSNAMVPLKAGRATKWILKRTTGKSENYFVTTDFRNFKQVSQLDEYTAYNWSEGELLEWKQLDDRITQGVLYKPKNFDPTKKYPVIIAFYNQKSHRLYDMPHPRFSTSADINIPWFVTREYLVLAPDIYFTDGDIYNSVVNTIVGAGQYLQSLPFVDSGRMAIAGHSQAGGFTNYLVTKTSMFAAALEGAGQSNAVSSTLQLLPDGGERIHISQYTFGESLWENPEKYINASPVFSLKKVTSPLLIFHCENDGSVPFEQALEMFLGLKRLDKRVWIIDYDDGGHVVFGEQAKDFSVRITQFFDHYLKRQAAPKWMTQGIPASKKGIESAFELDTSAKCGDNCEVCSAVY